MATKKIQILDSLNKNAVLYAPQELTEEQKAQARENINAASLDENGKVPMEQLPDNIGSGITSWNDLKDKPFGETGWSIEWDGETSGLESFEVSLSDICYKVASDMPTRDDLIGATVYVRRHGQLVEEIIGSEQSDKAGSLFYTHNGNLVCVDSDGRFIFFVIYTSGTDYFSDSYDDHEINPTSEGVWFYYTQFWTGEEEHIYCIKKEGGVKKIDEKYIPDTIARKTDISNIDLSGKADLVDGKIPTEQLPDDIGGGITSWNDLEDKPFGETGFKYEWDGNTEGLEDLSAVTGIVLYRVSQSTLSKDELLDTEYLFHFNGNDYIDNINSASVIDGSNGSMLVLWNSQLPIVLVTTTAGTETIMGIEMEIPSEGIWLLRMSDTEYVKYIQKDYSFKTLDKKFIPSDIGGGVDSWNDLKDKPFGETGWSAVWDGNPETALEEPFGVPAMGATLYKISAETPSSEECVGSYVKYALANGEVIESTIASAQDTDSEDCFVLMGDTMGLFAVALKDGSYSFMGIPFVLTAGVWSVVVEGAYMPLQLGESSIVKIDEKYLPDNIGGGISEVAWEDIKDKPFYEEGYKFTYNEFQTYESFSVPTMGATLYKIGEAKTKEELVGATGKYILGGDEREFVVGSNSFQDCTDSRGFILMGDNMGLFAVSSEAITTEFMGISFSFPSAGTWNVCVSGAYTPTYLGKVELKQIDKKFIPDDITAAISLTFDEFPTEGSQNPVKSMGIHSAISALEGKITSTFCYKGTVENYSDLPMDGNVIGDVWNIANADEPHGVEAGDNAAWDGESWDILAGVIDLSDYYTKAEIDSIALNGTVNLANYYTKSEINNMIGNCDAIINSINTLIGGGNI